MKHAEQTIVDLEARLQELNAEAYKIKTAINCLCDITGEPLRYDDVVEKSAQNALPRPDQYYGRPLATVVTETLDKRKAAGSGAATLDEIYIELVAGGYKFTGKNDGIKKRGLAISMSKNPKFHRLPNDTWGLTEWYPGVRESKEANAQTKGENGIISEILPEENTGMAKNE